MASNFIEAIYAPSSVKYFSSGIILLQQEGDIVNEQEYIDVSDRVRVSNALQILDDIIPEKSSVISPSELQHVLTALR